MTKTNKPKTQRNMCWTTLCANKTICFIENGYNGVLKALRDLQINDANLAYAVEKYVKRKGIQLSYKYLLKDI